MITILKLLKRLTLLILFYTLWCFFCFAIAMPAISAFVSHFIYGEPRGLHELLREYTSRVLSTPLEQVNNIQVILGFINICLVPAIFLALESLYGIGGAILISIVMLVILSVLRLPYHNFLTTAFISSVPLMWFVTKIISLILRINNLGLRFIGLFS